MWSQSFPQLPLLPTIASLAPFNPTAFCEDSYDNEPINAQNASIFVDSSCYDQSMSSTDHGRFPHINDLYDSYPHLTPQSLINGRSMLFENVSCSESYSSTSSRSSSVETERSFVVDAVPALLSGPTTHSYMPVADGQSCSDVGAAYIDNVPQLKSFDRARSQGHSDVKPIKVKALRSSRKKAKLSTVATPSSSSDHSDREDMVIETVELFNPATDDTQEVSETDEDLVTRKLDFGIIKSEDGGATIDIKEETVKQQPSETELDEKPYDRSEFFTKDNKPRQRAKRRKVTDISSHEIWRCCYDPCEQKYKRTSSISINRHKEICAHRPGAFSETLAQLTTTALQAALTQSPPCVAGDTNKLSNATISNITQLAALQTLLSMAGLNGSTTPSTVTHVDAKQLSSSQSMNDTSPKASDAKSSSLDSMTAELIARHTLEAAHLINNQHTSTGHLTRASSEATSNKPVKRKSLFSVPPPSNLSMVTPPRHLPVASLSMKPRFELDCSDVDTVDPAIMFGMEFSNDPFPLPKSPVSAPTTMRSTYDQMPHFSHPLNNISRSRLMTPQHSRAMSANFSAEDYRMVMQFGYQQGTIDGQEHNFMLSGLSDAQELFSNL